MADESTPVAVPLYGCVVCTQEHVLDNTEVVFDERRCICLNCVADALPTIHARRQRDRERFLAEIAAAAGIAAPPAESL